VEIIIDDAGLDRVERREFEMRHRHVEIAVRADVLTGDLTENPAAETAVTPSGEERIVGLLEPVARVGVAAEMRMVEQCGCCNVGPRGGGAFSIRLVFSAKLSVVLTWCSASDAGTFSPWYCQLSYLYDRLSSSHPEKNPPSSLASLNLSSMIVERLENASAYSLNHRSCSRI
jgi:hypothetical protein